MALKQSLKIFGLIIYFIRFCPVISTCVPEGYPDDLLNCLITIGKGIDIRKIPGEIASSYCYKCYQWKVGGNRASMNKPSESWKKSPDFLNMHIKSSGTERKKRQANQKIIRKEYRMLTDQERERYHSAVNQLRLETFGGEFPNGVYKFIKDVHANLNKFATHMGSNFLSWHRIYLRWYEKYLQMVDPQVTVPYWDATLDAENKENAKLSKIFSHNFFGDSDLSDGPYKDWGLVRNVGAYGELINANDISMILAQDSNFDINFIINITKFESNLEIKHGRMHTFVGGDLSQLVTATDDPIFFSLHAYVDYIWEKFRRKIRKPTEYPDDAFNFENHKSVDQMPFFYNTTIDGFNVIYNKDGYSNFWTDNIYEYEESPAFDCEQCETSQYLTCDEKTLKCRALIQGEQKVSRKKRSPRNNFDVPKFKRLREQNVCPDLKCPKDNAVQNTFRINENEALPDAWKIMPFEVMYKRPPGLRFRSYKIRNGHREKNMDLFDNGEIESTPKLATNQYCLKSNSGYTRVFVNIYGISYRGMSTEYAIVDQRFPISSSFAYVPVKAPTEEEDVQIAVMAYDECGRLCRPMCKSANGEYNPCSGVIRLTGISSTSCQSTVKDAVSRLWGYGSSYKVEQDYTSLPCVKIVCDHSITFPWENFGHGMTNYI